MRVKQALRAAEQRVRKTGSRTVEVAKAGMQDVQARMNHGYVGAGATERHRENLRAKCESRRAIVSVNGRDVEEITVTGSKRAAS